nr:EOG090X00BV [Eurycercus lamellatus]
MNRFGQKPQVVSPHYYPKTLTFGFLTSDDIRKVSLVQITNPETYDALGNPNTGGLCDPVMGMVEDKYGRCVTCGLKFAECPGHYGHIELPLPCFHPLFLRTIIKILKLTCPVCQRFKFSERQKTIFSGQLELLKYGLITDAQQLMESMENRDYEAGEEDEKVDRAQSDESDAQFKMEIEELVEKIKLKNGVTSQEDSMPTRNVESLRQAFVFNFIHDLSNGKSPCRKCKGGWNKMVLYKSQIVFDLKPNTEYCALGGVKLLDQAEQADEEPKNQVVKGKTPKKGKVTAKVMPTMILTPTEAKKHLRQVWKNDKEIFGYLYPVLPKTKSEYPTDVLFLDVIPVIPPKFRPNNFTDGKMKENGQTMILRKIILSTYSLKSALFAHNNPDVPLPPESERFFRNLTGATAAEKFQNAWLEMQEDVSMIADTSTSKEANNMMGFKQLMEKKEGLLRMHMMGKRVNYAARSVITPDPNLDVEEVGIPEVFAKKLTYPTPVTSWNIYEMRELVRNGPDIYPGAEAIEETNGNLINLPKDPAQREAMAKTLLTPSEAPLFKPKIVYRHLQSGDILLLNRQPTLHKPSIMAHKARVLMGEKTLRLHYANCKAYNADFDGDEMNAHFPQNEVARSEGYNIVAVPHQYLVPKDGTPLSGLIQDHMIAGVKLTIRGRFFNKADYQQLVFAGLGGREYGAATKLLPPTILKPVTLWSGKQILSTIIMNLIPKTKPQINMDSTAKISIKDWQTNTQRPWKAGGTPLSTPIIMSESQVIFRQGELLCGVLDKMHYGSTSYGLVHAFSELYGGQYACRLLSSFSRLFTAFLQLHGFTLGVEDILVTPKADKKRKKILSRLQVIGDSTAARAVGIEPELVEKEGMKIVRERMEEAHLSRSTLKRMTIDREYKTETDKITNEVNKACIPSGLHRIFPDNNLSLMIQSGAKGSSVNAMQISCLLGQIELEGKRPPMMISGRSLPSFVAYDTSPRAGGFIAGRFMTGIRPQEFFFHCMAGREGLIDTAVKTSRSGYLQRCLVKHLEGVSVAYDQTVRDSDGSVLQFLYGEDGLDICKSQYLNDKGIPFLVANRDCIRLADVSVSDQDAQEQVESAQKLVKRYLKKNGTLKKTGRKSGFLNFSSRVQCDLDQMELESRKPRVGRTLSTDEIEKAWREMSFSEKESYSKKQGSPPDPVNAQYSLARHMDVLDEHLNDMMLRYLERPDANIGRQELRRLIYSKSISASCEPGEPVGVLAAQSIGEPSTQMTLNTFHFAGRGEMNVTLGIPRLREILCVASKAIQTPSMDIPLLLKGPKAVKQAEKLKLKLTRVTLADLLETVEVTERMSIRTSNRSRIYGLTFTFLPHSSYKDRYCVKPKQVLRYFETYFVGKVLIPGMNTEAKAQSMQNLFESKAAPVARPNKKKEDDDDGDGEGGDIEREDKTSAAASKKEDDADSSDDGGDGDDIDFSSSKIRSKHADEHEYDEDEDSRDKTVIDDEGFEEEVGQNDKKNKTIASDDEEEKEEGEINEAVQEGMQTEMTEVMEEAIETRKNAVLDLDSWIVDYEFDSKSSLSCRLTLSVPLTTHKVDMSSAMRRWAEKSVVYNVPGIKRAFVVPPKSDDDDVMIKTDGVNINAMFKHSKILDLNRLYCNDIHAVAKHYGVEAASRVIVKEVRNVFKVYGITVDPRHLSLVACFMTSGGGYRAFSRGGMADCTSPIQQMTFETATEFLKNAALQGKTDYLKTPSSRIVLGMPGLEGTGSFSLLQKLY